MPERAHVVLLDNIDSFSFNLVDELARRGARVTVHRNDRPASAIAEEAAGALLLVISPGPGRPAAAGCCLELIERCRGRVPIFGVCLGLQAIVEALGGRVGRAAQIVHGKAAPIEHDGAGLFAGLPNPMPVGRYHSLAATRVPPALAVTARAADGTVMAISHHALPITAVQFHPESVLTPGGGTLLDNVLTWAAACR